MRRIVTTLAASAAALLFLFGAAGAQPGVKVGVLKLTSSAPIFIGVEKGFFKEFGVWTRGWSTSRRPRPSRRRSPPISSTWGRPASPLPSTTSCWGESSSGSWPTRDVSGPAIRWSPSSCRRSRGTRGCVT